MGFGICQLRVGMGIATVKVMEVFWFCNWVAELVGDPRQCAGRKDGGNIAAHRRLVLLDEISRMPTDTLRLGHVFVSAKERRGEEKRGEWRGEENNKEEKRHERA